MCVTCLHGVGFGPVGTRPADSTFLQMWASCPNLEVSAGEQQPHFPSSAAAQGLSWSPCLWRHGQILYEHPGHSGNLHHLTPPAPSQIASFLPRGTDVLQQNFCASLHPAFREMGRSCLENPGLGFAMLQASFVISWQFLSPHAYPSSLLKISGSWQRKWEELLVLWPGWWMLVLFQQGSCPCQSISMGVPQGVLRLWWFLIWFSSLPLSPSPLNCSNLALCFQGTIPSQTCDNTKYYQHSSPVTPYELGWTTMELVTQQQLIFTVLLPFLLVCSPWV